MTINKGQPPAPSGTALPSDLELMQYFDGELEEPRRSAVAAFVGNDLHARNKMAGLRITSAIVQDRPKSLSAADNIADLVMAKIAAEAPPAAQIVSAPSPIVAFPGPLAARPAANDNSRRIFAAIGALAVAAAAALALWSRSGPTPNEPAKSTPIAVLTVPSTLSTPSSPEPEIDAAATNGDADAEHGVEVAAVNFGAHMGSIFYVPSGSIEAKRTTTVVWLADDAGE